MSATWLPSSTLLRIGLPCLPQREVAAHGVAGLQLGGAEVALEQSAGARMARAVKVVPFQLGEYRDGSSPDR